MLYDVIFVVVLALSSNINSSVFLINAPNKCFLSASILFSAVFTSDNTFFVFNGISSMPFNLIILLENDILVNWSIFSSVITRICVLIVCNSWTSNLNAYGTRIILNERPCLLTVSIFIVPSLL